MMSVISAVAEFKRDLLLERTHSGIARAKQLESDLVVLQH